MAKDEGERHVPVQVELNRCPAGCCFNVALRHQEGKELAVTDVQATLEVLHGILGEKGLPPKPDAPNEKKEKSRGKLEVVH